MSTQGVPRVELNSAWLSPSVLGSPFSVLRFAAGEIVGVAAIEGNGQRALLRGIAGVEPADGITVHGTVAFIPEDRTSEALIGEFTLAENLVLGTADADRRWIDWDSVKARTAALMTAYDVRAPGPKTLAGALSGGNQQKFVFARVLSGNPDVIVAEDPTRGLDVAATAAIHARLRAAADAGACVIVHSSDLDEVLLLADRLLVMADGRLTELPRDTPREVVGDAMLGITPAAPA